MDEKQLANAIAKGMGKAADKLILFVVIGYLFIGTAYWYTGGFERDDTDSSEQRSGMSLHTDYKTGCQYLSASRGGITPRLDEKGRHKGCGRK